MRDFFSQDYDERVQRGCHLPPKDKWVECMVKEPNYLEWLEL